MGPQAHGQAGEWGDLEDPGSCHTCSQAFHSRDVVPKPAGQSGQGQWPGGGEWGCVGAYVPLSAGPWVRQCALALSVHAGTHAGGRAVAEPLSGSERGLQIYLAVTGRG